MSVNMAAIMNTATLTTVTVREYDGTRDCYVARRDIPPLWTQRVGWWRQQWEALKGWAHNEGRVRG